MAIKMTSKAKPIDRMSPEIKRFLLLNIILMMTSLITAIKIDPDGGYKDLVIRISSDGGVPETDCPKILYNIKKLLNEGSHALYEALDEKVYLKSATIVIPHSWRDSVCQTEIRAPRAPTPYRNPDIKITDKHSLYGETPFTQRSRGCGEKGDFMSIPYQFLTAWNNTWETYGDPAKLFVKEWAKLRYGIFDERGYANDLLFPNYYHVDGEIYPTLTTNDRVKGEWIDTSGLAHCNPMKQECYFKPLGANNHITCSLGNMHYLPTVKQFCHKTNLPMAPTQHNVLCNGRSAGEIIDSHEDLKSRSVNSQKGQDAFKLDPDITVVRNPLPQYVLVVEKSADLDNNGQWKWINKAAQKFIRYDLPSNAKLAIVTFSNTSKVEHPMTKVNSDSTRARLADTIPDKYHLSHTDIKCLLCGVHKAIHDVLRNNMAGAHLVIISRGSPDTLSLSDEQTIREYIKYYQIEVSTILIPDKDKQPLPFFDEISQISGGNSHVIKSAQYTKTNSRRSIEVYIELMQAFSSLVAGEHNRESAPIVVHEELKEMNGYSSSKGRFTIDATLGRETNFGIYVDDEEDHLIKSVRFKDAKGTKYGPYTSMSSLYDIINLKTVNFPVGEAPPFDNPTLLGSKWEYTIEWYPGGSNFQRSAVRLTSRPRYGEDDIFIRIWTNSDTSSDIINLDRHHPLAIYAQVIKGSNPVLDAHVIVQITVTNQNGSDDHMKLTLLDNGNGDSDLAAGDGIYSRYLTKYISAGRYKFTAIATDNSGKAYTIRPNKSVSSSKFKIQSQGKRDHYFPIVGQISPQLLAPCCGSRIYVNEEDRVPTGAFTRTTDGVAGVSSVIHLLAVPKRSEDKMPPSRITDLRVEMLDNGQLVATWTAPGDDYDFGTVTGYRFVGAENISHLVDSKSDKLTLVGFSQKDEAGSQTSYQFEVQTDNLNEDRFLFVGLVAFDERDNEGKVSNIVTLHLTASGIYRSGSSASSQGIKKFAVLTSGQNTREDQGILIGALCGTLVVFALMLWGAIWYFRSKKLHPTKNGGVTANLVLENGGSSHNDSSNDVIVGLNQEQHSRSSTLRKSVGNMANLIPKFSTASDPVYDFEGSMGGPGENGVNTNMTVIQPIISTSNEINTPIYWSASQLLGEHEHQKQQQSLQQQSASNTLRKNTNSFPNNLDTISEEITDDLEYDADVYAQGLANYGYHTQQLQNLSHNDYSIYGRHESQHQSTSTPLKNNQTTMVAPTMSESLIANTSRLHEPVYVAYSPDSSQKIYGSSKKKKSAPKPPPQNPSVNTLLGIGILDNDAANYGQLSQSTNSLSKNYEDAYGTLKSKRSITHV